MTLWVVRIIYGLTKIELCQFAVSTLEINILDEYKSFIALASYFTMHFNLFNNFLPGNGFKVVNSSVMKNSLSLCQTTSRCRELMAKAVDGRAQTNEMNSATR